MKNTTTQTIERVDSLSVPIFWTLLVAIVLMAASYVYFINKTVRNIVLRQDLQAEMASVNSKLSETEFSYINSVGSITLDTAHQLGYVSATDKTFVTRERIGQNVAIR